MSTKANQFKLRPETHARYAAEHAAWKIEIAPRRKSSLEAEIAAAIKDGESQSYIDWLRAKLP
jgi:hypothetical protein